MFAAYCLTQRVGTLQGAGRIAKIAGVDLVEPQGTPQAQWLQNGNHGRRFCQHRAFQSQTARSLALASMLSSLSSLYSDEACRLDIVDLETLQELCAGMRVRQTGKDQVRWAEN